ncbi:MAG: hypothetical protein Q8T08_16035, partial [Ignavibacteria bacterium]|nr:hypothetical protein [Ignavibacteria bacterium]
MKRALFFVSLFLTILSLSSCRKQIDYTGEKKLDKLVIPANFTWETTKTITVTITSDVSRVITITSEDGSVRYHKGFFNLSSDNYVVSLRIPTLTESLQI